MDVTGLSHYELGPSEIDHISERLLDATGGETPVEGSFYDANWRAVNSLPGGLRDHLALFRRNEDHAGTIVRGYPVPSGDLGPTPDHWDRAVTEGALACETYLAACAMALGEPFAWATLQSGRLVQNVLPIAGDELRQSGHGSKALLEFHTEDGFHDGRCDYLLLLGLRNPDGVATIVSSVRDVVLTDADRRVLSQPRFHIVPDPEHIRQLQEISPTHPALDKMIGLRDRPEPVAVLTGDPRQPYLRIDRPFMRCADDDSEAECALDRLMEELERVHVDVVVEPGTVLIVDNHVAVHGRRPFDQRYDGTDRWLKKITVRRDLRRWQAEPVNASHRVLY